MDILRGKMYVIKWYRMKRAVATFCIKGAYAFSWTYIQNFKKGTQENTKAITVINLVSGIGKEERKERTLLFILNISICLGYIHYCSWWEGLQGRNFGIISWRYRKRVGKYLLVLYSQQQNEQRTLLCWRKNVI